MASPRRGQPTSRSAVESEPEQKSAQSWCQASAPHLHAEGLGFFEEGLKHPLALRLSDGPGLEPWPPTWQGVLVADPFLAPSASLCTGGGRSAMPHLHDRQGWGAVDL